MVNLRDKVNNYRNQIDGSLEWFIFVTRLQKEFNFRTNDQLQRESFSTVFKKGEFFHFHLKKPLILEIKKWKVTEQEVSTSASAFQVSPIFS